MTANVNVTKLLFKRGNTAQNAAYTGINGEITVDTQAKTLRIHDGITAGGNIITAGGVVGSYSNTNAAAYIPTDPTITSIQANVAAANAAISAIAGIDTSLIANAATQQTQINSLDANITAANAAITSLQSNAGVQAVGIGTVNANIGAYQTYANANAATQATSINSINANLGSFQTYANATFGTSNYGNTNVAAYLGAFNGNILPSANITYSLGSEQFQWRDLWVSNNTIYIGNTPLRVDGTTLLVNNAPVSGSTYSNTNVAAYLLGNITTGNIKSGNLAATGNIVTNVRHWDSAGANLYVWLNAANTPELVILGTFGNIAGWTVSVSDGNSATITETNPAGYFSISTNVGLTGSGNLTFTSPDYQVQTPAPLTISSGSSTWTFGNDGNLTIAGNINYANGTSILDGIGGGGVTGNISVDTSAIQFVASSSGDGNGYSTIRLIPDTNLEGTDQYLIIDPTAPGHIHIRAGGDQDSSSADLMLGGENSHVLITAGSNPPVYIRASSASWMFGVDSSLSMPTGGNLYFDSSATSVIDGITSVILTDPGFIRHSNLTSEIILSENTFRFESNVGTGSSYIEGQQNELFLIGNLTTLIGAGGSTWEFTANGNIILATSGDNPDRGIVYGDGSFQSTAWTGFGNTIAIGYSTGTVSQGSEAVAIGRLAGNVNQGGVSVAIGRAAGRDNQGVEAVGIGADAGQQNQGDYAIAIGSVTAYLNQGLGAVAIGTSAGSVNQGTHAIAIGTGAGTGNQGNSSIILNATGSPLEQTTDNTFTVKPIRNASGSNVLYYDSSTGEITYDTASGGTYGNTEVAAYLPTYTGNISAGNVNVASTVYAANIVTSGTSGNISGVNVISANTFVFAANGVNILSAAGGGAYGNTEVAAYLLTWPNIDSNILDVTSANITTLRAANFNSANAVISGGYISALTNASITTATITTLNSTGGNITTLRVNNFGTANAVITGGYINSLANLSATTAVFTNFSTGNAVINGGYISSLTNASITTSVVTNFSTANAVITGGYASGLANVTATGNVTAGNLIGYGSNTNIVAGAYTSTFDNVGNVILPNAYVSGNTTVMGIAPGYAPNRPAFRVYGSGVNTTQTTGNVNLKNEVLTVDYNQGNYYDNTTGVFTAPVSGLYNTTLVARVANNNGLNQVAVLRNGNNIGANVVCFWETDTNAGVATHFGTSGTILLNAGEFLSANILAGNISFDGNDSWTVTYLG